MLVHLLLHIGNIMENNPSFYPNRDAKLMEQVKEVLRYHHYAYRTEQTYCQWILRYIKFYGCNTHPRNLGAQAIERFLSHLVDKDKVASSTQHQALNAIMFLYREVLHLPVDGKIAPSKAKLKRRIPTVLVVKEVELLFAQMSGTHVLMAQLLYGSGLRLMECIRLRIQDVDFGQNKIYVRNGKGGKDRTTFLPSAIRHALKNHIDRIEILHHQDLEEGFGHVYLPGALVGKYPNASRETAWQYVFPSKKRSADPRSGIVRRHHVKESGLQKAVKQACKRSLINKHATCHTLRHSFATHLLENGNNIRMVQKLMGHANVKTTEIYTHVMQDNLDNSKSPLDILKQQAL